MRFLRKLRPRTIGEPARTSAITSLVYFTPDNVLAPDVNRLCIMRFCEAMAKGGNAVEVVSLDVQLDSSKPTDTRDLWSIYGLSTKFKIVILPSWARQRGAGSGAYAIWRALVYSVYGLRLLWRLRASDRRRTVFYFKNYLFGAMFVLLRKLFRGSPLLVLEMHTPPHHFLARRLVSRLDGIVSVSHILERELLSDYGVPRERLLVAHQGVDLGFVERRRRTKMEARRTLGLPFDRKLVVYTGQVEESPGGEIDLLAEAARRSGPDVEFVIVGGGKNAVRELRNRFAHERLENIRMVGFVAPADVFDYQMAADALVTYYPRDIPINKYRASPGKLFEYMASKRPIVTADIPALREVLSPAAAYFVEPDQPGVLADAIDTVLRDDTLGESLANAAYADVQRFTWDERAERVSAFIARLCEARIGVL